MGKKRLTFAESKGLLEYARTSERRYQFRDYLICKTLYMTGIRAEELVKLCWKQLGQNVKEEFYLFEVVGKGSKRRDIYFPERKQYQTTPLDQVGQLHCRRNWAGRAGQKNLSTLVPAYLCNACQTKRCTYRRRLCSTGTLGSECHCRVQSQLGVHSCRWSCF